METSISTTAFPPDKPIEDIISRSAPAGFGAIEIAVGPTGAVTYDTANADCRQLGRRVADAGLKTSALAAEGFQDAHFASPDAVQRQLAHDRTLALLDRAAWLGAAAIIIPPVLLPPGGHPEQPLRYEDAYLLALDALIALRFEAEARAVQITCQVCRNRFLLTPPEARDFLDRINSPWVGACVDISATSVFGRPADWIESLGHRVHQVWIADLTEAAEPGPTASQDNADPELAAAIKSLARIRYPGFVTLRGCTEPAASAARLRSTLTTAARQNVLHGATK